MNILKDYLWTLPFLSFLLGYQLLSFITVTDNLTNPAIIGLPLSQAVKALSDHNLNPRIVAEKEEPDLPEGTVLQQTPAAQQKVRPNQPIFLVVSKKPKKIIAPFLLNKTKDGAESALHQLSVRAKIYELSAQTPIETCIGQSPDAEETIENKKMILYVSTGKNTLMLFPNLKGAIMHDVQNCLNNYNFTTKIFHTYPTDANHQCTTCVVVDQKPLPGSIVDVRKPVYVQLQVQ